MNKRKTANIWKNILFATIDIQEKKTLDYKNLLEQYKITVRCNN